MSHFKLCLWNLKETLTEYVPVNYSNIIIILYHCCFLLWLEKLLSQCRSTCSLVWQFRKHCQFYNLVMTSIDKVTKNCEEIFLKMTRNVYQTSFTCRLMLLSRKYKEYKLCCTQLSFPDKDILVQCVCVCMCDQNMLQFMTLWNIILQKSSIFQKADPSIKQKLILYLQNYMQNQ